MISRKCYFRYIAVVVSFVMANLANAQIEFANGKLRFGGASQFMNYPICIQGGGTYWTIDNKFFQLDLSANNPRLAGTDDKVVFYNTKTRKYNSIEVANVYNKSDERAKKNIKSFGDGLKNVLRLRPVSYNWKQDFDADAVVDGKMFAIGPTEEKGSQYGFLAQEVEEFLPELISTTEDGEKGINYIAMIPMLVESVQELQAKVEAQTQQIEQLKNSLPSTIVKKIHNCKISSCDVREDGYLNVDYTLSNNAKNCYITVKSILGLVEKKFEVSKNANYCLNDISDLKSGLHIVTLVVDGIHCDSKVFVWSRK